MNKQIDEPLFISDEYGTLGHEGSLVREACMAISNIRNNYVGNKRRILYSVWEAATSGEKPIKITDAFGGSGSVSALFAAMGCEVSYNDLLLSSCVQASCLLSKNQTTLSKEEWEVLMNDANGEKAFSFARTFYAGKFFTDAEALFMDRYIGNARLIYGSPKQGRLVSNNENSSLTSKGLQAFCAFVGHINSTCFIGGRFYNGQTIAKKDHRIAHVKNNGVELHKSFADSISRIPSIEYPRGCLASVYNMDAVDLLSKTIPEGDLLYLDPPYGGDSSDYAALYRFIEECVTGCRYEDDKARIEKASKFKNSKGYSELFLDVLNAASGYRTWLISFNRTSFAPLDEIKALISNAGRKVEIVTVPISYNYRKNRRNIAVGEKFTDVDGIVKRKPHIVSGTDDELLIVAKRT